MRNVGLNPWVAPGLVRLYMPNLSLHMLKARAVAEIVCNELQVDINRVLRSKSRRRQWVIPRQVICYILCHNTTMSLKDIGEFLNPDHPYDHTTVIHGRETIRDLMETDEAIASIVSKVFQRVSSEKSYELPTTIPQT